MDDEADARRKLGFFCAYPVQGTRLAILNGLRAYGLSPRLARAPDCVFQWAPYSKLLWNRTLEGSLLVSSYIAHAGLTDKARLMQLLDAFAAGDAACAEDAIAARSLLCPFRQLSPADAARLPEVMAGLEHDGAGGERAPWWVLKGATDNNATEIHFVSAGSESARAIAAAAAQDCAGASDAEEGGRPRSWLLQAVVPWPLLHRGRFKFHIRCNVLAIGRLRVFAHRDCVLHVACEPYREADWDDRFVHVTNHLAQRAHPRYDPAANQISLRALESALDEARGVPTDAAARIWANVRRGVRAVFAAVCARGGKQDLFATPDAFEVFGFDFMVQDDAGLTLKLLEVNHGPALEGHASMSNGDGCRGVVQDVLAMVVPPLLRAGGAREGGEVPAAEVPAAFEEVFALEPAQFLSERLRGYVRALLSQNCELKREENVGNGRTEGDRAVTQVGASRAGS